MSVVKPTKVTTTGSIKECYVVTQLTNQNSKTSHVVDAKRGETRVAGEERGKTLVNKIPIGSGFARDWLNIEISSDC